MNYLHSLVYTSIATVITALVNIFISYITMDSGKIIAGEHIILNGHRYEVISIENHS
jgi:hypothetical protein